MWIVDSSVWIDYFNGTSTPEVEILDGALGKRELAIGEIILMEVLQGFRSQREYLIARDALLNLPIHAMGGLHLTLKSVENYRRLRRRGITIRTPIDCLIATYVIENGFELLHSDRDFHLFEQHLGLNVVSE